MWRFPLGSCALHVVLDHFFGFRFWFGSGYCLASARGGPEKSDSGISGILA